MPTESSRVGELRRSLYDDLLTYDEAAMALKVSRNTLGRIVKAGELPAFRIGASRYISETHLRRYVDRLREAAEIPAIRRSTEEDPTP